MTPSEPEPALPLLGRAHARRLRDIYRSAGWPCQDGLELELLAAGLLERVREPQGHERVRLTDAGIAFVARQMARNRQALSAHEALVRRVAQQLGQQGRIAWCGLALRALVAQESQAEPAWNVARPDVFSIRHTSVAQYVEPVVHEIKVKRSDLLADLRQPAKRAAYLALGECWYVLGQDSRGRPIAQPQEIPPECGVLLAWEDRLEVARPALRRERQPLPFAVWMALARAPAAYVPPDEPAQGLLAHDEEDGAPERQWPDVSDLGDPGEEA